MKFSKIKIVLYCLQALALTGCSMFETKKESSTNVACALPTAITEKGSTERKKPRQVSIEEKKEDPYIEVVDSDDDFGDKDSWSMYTVRAGDTIFGIAKKFGTRPSEIMAANGLSRDSKLYVGQQIKVSGQTDEVYPELVLPTEEQEYTVQKGDTIYGLARRFGVRPSDIMDPNGLNRDSRLYVGQKLMIGTGQSTEKSRNAATTEYTVVPGDSLYKISKKFGISIQSIRDANSLQSDVLRVGQKLIISKDKEHGYIGLNKQGPSATASERQQDIYKVERGDNLTSIAKKTGVKVSEIEKANNLERPDELKVGQELRIPRNAAVGSGAVVANKNALNRNNTALPQLDNGIYTVMRGDNISLIAGKFGVKSSDIIRENDLKAPDALQVGQKIRIPKATVQVNDQKSVDQQSASGNRDKTPAAKSEEKQAVNTAESTDDFFDNFESIPVIETRN